jgi:hypothetical protein
MFRLASSVDPAGTQERSVRGHVDGKKLQFQGNKARFQGVYLT